MSIMEELVALRVEINKRETAAQAEFSKLHKWMDDVSKDSSHMVNKLRSELWRKYYDRMTAQIDEEMQKNHAELLDKTRNIEIEYDKHRREINNKYYDAEYKAMLDTANAMEKALKKELKAALKRLDSAIKDE